MNFKERYRTEMDQYVPSADSTQRLEAAIRAARKPKKSQLRRFQVGVGSLALACVALIALFIVISHSPDAAGPLSGAPIASSQIATGDAVRLQSGGTDYKNVAALFTRIQKDQEKLNESRNTSKGISISEFFSNGAASAPKASAPAVGAQIDAADRAPQTAEPDYSSTNIQVEGVQEGDVVKTDGHYIYALSSAQLRVIDPHNGSPRQIATISFPAVTQSSGEESFFEVYLQGNRLIGLEKSFSDERSIREPSEDSTADSGPLRQIQPDESATLATKLAQTDVVTAVIFDVSDPAHPRRLNSLTQSGEYVSSRMIGDKLYLVTTDYRTGYQSGPQTSHKDPGQFVPYTAQNGAPTLLKPDEISLYPNAQSTTYVVTTAIDTAGSGVILSRCSILGGGDLIYAGLDNLYVFGGGFLRQDGQIIDSTTITRIALAGDKLQVKAAQRIPGRINDQFSIDESKAVLRVVTTVETFQDSQGYLSSDGSKQSNGLYCLNSDLAVIGKIEGIAPGEKIYSCRYLDDYAYFVTFRTVDPLFTADLSDPEHPKLVGALKIPGFSEYLHPWSSTELFGLGNTVTPNATENGVRRSDLKIAMFDTSDPINVTVKHELTIPGKVYSEASYDHHAILISPEKNLIAFPAQSSYLIYRYDEARGFTKVTEISMDGVADYLRGLFINDKFYVITPEAIASYQMPGFETIVSSYYDSLPLPK